MNNQAVECLDRGLTSEATTMLQATVRQLLFALRTSSSIGHSAGHSKHLDLGMRDPSESGVSEVPEQHLLVPLFSCQPHDVEHVTAKSTDSNSSGDFECYGSVFLIHRGDPGRSERATKENVANLLSCVTAVVAYNLALLNHTASRMTVQSLYKQSRNTIENEMQYTLKLYGASLELLDTVKSASRRKNIAKLQQQRDPIVPSLPNTTATATSDISSASSATQSAEIEPNDEWSSWWPIQVAALNNTGHIYSIRFDYANIRRTVRSMQTLIATLYEDPTSASQLESEDDQQVRIMSLVSGLFFADKSRSRMGSLQAPAA
jgi:hypothetical protein